MIDLSKAEKLVEDNLAPIQKQLGITDWAVEYYFEPITGDDHAAMGCSMEPDYKRAHITIDVSRVENEDKLLVYLRHELIHILAAEFFVYNESIECTFKDRPKEWGALQRLFHYAAEQNVWRIEKMLDAQK